MQPVVMVTAMSIELDIIRPNRFIKQIAGFRTQETAADQDTALGTGEHTIGFGILGIVGHHDAVGVRIGQFLNVFAIRRRNRNTCRLSAKPADFDERQPRRRT